jgi:lysophospholipase L1-like esterase
VRRFLRNLAFSLLVAGLVLGGLEIGLRLAGWPDPGIYAGDPAILWWLRPSLAPRPLPFAEAGSSFSVRTNSLGFRGPEPVPGGVLCLGDSTTFGWGVEEEQAWPARLAALTGAPVVNGGVPGYSTVQGLARVDLALSIRPKVVILAYLVRDAELAPIPDRLRRPSPQIQILKAMRALRSARPGGDASGVPRVPPEEYRENVERLVAEVKAVKAAPVLLAFPTSPARPAPEGWLQVLRTMNAGILLIEPSLPADDFFEADPMHLDVAGNDALARVVAYELQSHGLSPAPAAMSTPGATP